MTGEPWAWGVQTPDGYRAAFVDRAKAEQYAANTHGVLVPLSAPAKPETPPGGTSLC